MLKPSRLKTDAADVGKKREKKHKLAVPRVYSAKTVETLFTFTRLVNKRNIFIILNSLIFLIPSTKRYNFIESLFSQRA